ncbi:germination protein YpeB [Alkalicoccobacillus murimartini]|uniref:Spore germination protein n=1 Tax=Alkalicoccobacillus murimartini TaxID=171685 RepID=A0ABT9YDG3_9BACI|nr:germination protein YpeB [Alkalicoccobacillus murimartini]MDQ0205897.1 spore germination protein [Alkalicoccobacillus murimartini]
MFRNIIIGIAAAALIGTGWWGFQQKGESDQLRIQAENSYQRAFHDLTFNLDQIEDELGKTLAMNTRRQLTPSLAEVWRITSLAQKNIAELPVQSVKTSDAEEFLYRIGDFSYRTSVRDLDKEPLTDKEYQTLTDLHKHAGTIRESMRKMQAQAMNDKHRWVEASLNDDQTQGEESVPGQFELMNKSVEGFTEVDWGASKDAIRDINGELKEALKGKEITEEEAQEIGRSYAGVGKGAKVNVTRTGKGLEYPAYTLVIDDPDHEAHYYMDVSINGGEPIWFMQDRKMGKQTVGLNEASEIAKNFLDNHGKKGMELVDSTQYDTTGVFEYVYKQDEARIYPDSILIEVALDNGDVTSYEAKGYLINHQEDRDIATPKISREEAAIKVNPKVEIMEEHIGVIKNNINEEVLCYEFLGVLDDDSYRIFINAEDGQEEKVERLVQSEPVYQ